MKKIENYDYCGCRIEIYETVEGFNYKIFDYDDNNILDECLFDSEDEEDYYDNAEDAKEQAEIRIDDLIEEY